MDTMADLKIPITEKILNIICFLFRVPKYSMIRDYSPIAFMSSLKDEPNQVYIWVLKPGIDRALYKEQLLKYMLENDIYFKAHHFFVQDVEEIKFMPEQHMRPIVKYYHSKEAKDGGR